MKDLVKIKVINPRALGKLNGVEVFLTKKLEEELKKQNNFKHPMFERT